MKILFNDNHLIVAFKEQNINKEKFLKDLKTELEKNNLKSSFLEPIYELSAEEGGIVVVALSSKAKQRLLNQIEEGEFMLKHYAVCVGKPKYNNRFINLDENEEINCQFVHRNLKTNLLEFIPRLNADAKKIYDPYKILEDKQKISLVEICGGFAFFDELRFLLSDAQSPVFGDKMYGGETLAKNTNLALFAVEVRFLHPILNKNMTFRCYPPCEKKPWSYFSVEKFLRL